MARALDYAHRRGLVHRDIKPANLIFDDEGRITVADFGLARALAEATWTEPAGAVVGTARYAAPEAVRGESLDSRADVYALALVLIEATTGSVPFAADTTLATLLGRLEQPVTAPAATGPSGPSWRPPGPPTPADRLDAIGLARALDGVAARAASAGSAAAGRPGGGRGRSRPQPDRLPRPAPALRRRPGRSVGPTSARPDGGRGRHGRTGVGRRAPDRASDRADPDQASAGRRRADGAPPGAPQPSWWRWSRGLCWPPSAPSRCGRPGP